MKIIECPRDAMQGLTDFIPTKQKIDYINTLLKVGFDTIDFGSFVSPKAIPQMRDTKEVLAGLDLSETKSKLLVIIANKRGAEEAIRFEEISYLGFPLSISETFQQRNTNKSIEEALQTVEDIYQLCQSSSKKLVVYISMGFGNPYNEPYNSEIVIGFVKKLDKMGIEIISLSDTIGNAIPELIGELFASLIPEFPHIEFGAHFHSTPELASNKITAAYKAGCQRFDGAIGGMGGCPMAKDDLTGNIGTEIIIGTLKGLNVPTHINMSEFIVAEQMKIEVFG
jgi:hydroxymethylglutaryl-CoA lyase